MNNLFSLSNDECTYLILSYVHDIYTHIINNEIHVSVQMTLTFNTYSVIILMYSKINDKD